MDSLSIVLAIVLIVVFIALYKIFKTVIHAIMVMVTIISVLLIVASVMLVMDASDIKNKYPTEEKIFILADNTTILTGFVQGADLVPISPAELAGYSAALNKKDYSAILGPHYKLFIIDINAIDALPDGIMVDNQSLAKPQLVDILEGKPSPLFIGADAQQVRSGLFALSVQKVMSDPVFIISQFRKGNIIIYPETVLFKFLRYFPLRLIVSQLQSGLARVGNSSVV